MTVDFNRLESLGRDLDGDGMLDLVSSFAEQMADAWEIGGRFAASLNKINASRIVVCGMGGSAIGGDMVRSFLGDRLEVPLDVNRNFDVPRSLFKDALFVFSSYSGNTAETLAGYNSARKVGARAIAITSGGELAGRCAEDGIPVCEIPGGKPPRSAIAYSFFPLLRSLAAMGLADVTDAEFKEAHEVLRELCRVYRSDSPDNRAAALAYELEGKLPFVYSGSGLLEAVARRWSTQINENSKSLAHYAVLPELTHNEIVGWSALASVRDDILIVRLDDEDDHVTARKQASIAMEVTEPHCAGIVSVSGAKGGRMTRILSTMILGDFVSVYLGYLNGADPTPVTNIDILKQRMKDDARDVR